MMTYEKVVEKMILDECNTWLSCKLIPHGMFPVIYCSPTVVTTEAKTAYIAFQVACEIQFVKHCSIKATIEGSITDFGIRCNRIVGDIEYLDDGDRPRPENLDTILR